MTTNHFPETWPKLEDKDMKDTAVDERAMAAVYKQWTDTYHAEKKEWPVIEMAAINHGYSAGEREAYRKVGEELRAMVDAPATGPGRQSLEIVGRVDRYIESLRKQAGGNDDR